MQHVTKWITQPRRESPEPVPSGSAEPQSERAMARLWIRMTRIYGHRWTSSFGETDDGTWAKGLRGLSGEQIALGLSRCVVSGEAWPPTLPEFRALCTSTAEDLGLPPPGRRLPRSCDGGSRPPMEPPRGLCGREGGGSL